MDFIVVQAYAMTRLAKSAHLILPGLAPFEREGTITNDQGRVQWVRSVLPNNGESRPDWEILNLLYKTGERFSDINELMKRMGEQFPSYSGITFFKLGDQGLPLNGNLKT